MKEDDYTDPLVLTSAYQFGQPTGQPQSVFFMKDRS